MTIEGIALGMPERKIVALFGKPVVEGKSIEHDFIEEFSTPDAHNVWVGYDWSRNVDYVAGQQVENNGIPIAHVGEEISAGLRRLGRLTYLSGPPHRSAAGYRLEGSNLTLITRDAGENGEAETGRIHDIHLEPKTCAGWCFM